MRGRPAWIATLIIALSGCRGLLAESPSQDCSVGHIGPAGGWFPYGGGLLHWWPPHCFPCDAAPDDYCRKPLPVVCRPCYPPFYRWVPSEVSYPPCDCRLPSPEPR
jgi:hypothetical protein